MYLEAPMDRTCRDRPRLLWRLGVELRWPSSLGSEPRAPRRWGGIGSPGVGSADAVIAGTRRRSRCSPWERRGTSRYETLASYCSFCFSRIFS